MTIETLQSFSVPAGFNSSASFKELADHGLDRVPSQPGVYMVLSPKVKPSLSEVSCGGHFKGRNPAVPVSLLEAKWIDGAPVLYVGKANELRRRIREFVAFGSGKAIGHWGGRYIWQLAGCQDLRVSWMTTGDEDPRSVERRMLSEFSLVYGRIPFANLAA